MCLITSGNHTPGRLVQVVTLTFRVGEGGGGKTGHRESFFLGGGGGGGGGH